MISKQEVKHIAKLARIGITKKEEEKFAKDLSSVLDYIEKLKEVDVSRIKPTSLSLDIENVMRSDKESSKFSEGKPSASYGAGKIQNSKLLDLAPETKKGYLKVKPIL
jgi:aspartyl-tRNA(Asn)/glutamyl-tRNA(Gln) amidotransferase subunit C